MQEVTNDNLKEIIEKNDNVIVQYGASWCGMCRVIKPKFNRLSEENKDVIFVYVDAENNPESRSLATIDNLPTFAGFSKGELVKQVTSSKEEAIKEVLDEITNN